MENNTLIVFDLSRKIGIEYAIILDCYYPTDIDEKKKGDLAESIVLYTKCKDLNHAKNEAKVLWSMYSPGAIKSLLIKEETVIVARSNNFDKFK